MFDSTNCTVIPEVAKSDAGVAGAGVLLSFIITAGWAILLSAAIVFYELHSNSSSRILRKLLLALSDQQIITGIGIQCVGLTKTDSIVPYHFFIIWMLSVLSTSTHLATLLALVNDFKRDWVLRWLRQFLMFVNLVLSCVFGIFLLRIVMLNMDKTLPVSCVWHAADDGHAQGNAGISIAGTIAVIVGSCGVFILGVWYLHSQHRKWTKFIQIGGLLLLAAFGAGAAIRVLQVSQAFGSPDVKLNNEDEKAWSFGQLLPLLLLLLPLISAIEIIRGEVNVPMTIADDGIPLVDSEKHMHHDPFQPNPLFDSRGNRRR